MLLTRRASILPMLWVVIGVVVAYSFDKFENVTTVTALLNAILAVLLWPLLLLGIHIGT